MAIKEIMAVQVLSCGDTGYIRTGVHNSKRLYLLLDIMGYLKTNLKSGCVVKPLMKEDVVRCSVWGIPGRPNILITLRGLETVLQNIPVLTPDLHIFVQNEEILRKDEVITPPAPITPAWEPDPIVVSDLDLEHSIEEPEQEYVPLVPDEINFKKLEKRIKKMEKMMTHIYKELV